MHPLDEVMRSLRAAGLSIDEFTEHYRVPWQILPITEPQGEGMFGWPAERWLPLSYEVVASAPHHSEQDSGALPRLDGGCHAC
jgi:hypothetical protein